MRRDPKEPSGCFLASGELAPKILPQDAVLRCFP